MTEKRPQLEGIQVLRALGLFVVIQAHVAMQVITNTFGNEDFPNLLSRLFTITGKGVLDVFFVISGFIMVYISRDVFGRKGAARQFFLMRLTRVVPVYWLYTSLAIALPLLIGSTWVFDDVSIAEALKSYLFIPYHNDLLPPLYAGGGTLYPALVVGWTLNFEMLFYTLFAFGLLLSLRSALISLSLIMAVAAIAHQFIPYQSAPLFFWTLPIMWKFMFGCWIGYFYIHGIRWNARRSIVMASMLAAFAGHCLLYSMLLGVDWVWFQTLTGLLAAVIVAGVTLTDYQHSPGPKLLVKIGDASYSGYLCHMFVIVVIFAVFENLLVMDFMARVVLGIITFGLVLICAHYSYRLVELPLIAYFRRRLKSP